MAELADCESAAAEAVALLVTALGVGTDGAATGLGTTGGATGVARRKFYHTIKKEHNFVNICSNTILPYAHDFVHTYSVYNEAH